MAVKSLAQLQTEATTIRDEVVTNANTALRVGTALLDMVDSMAINPANGTDDGRVAWANAGALDFAAFITTDGATFLGVGANQPSTGAIRLGRTLAIHSQTFAGTTTALLGTDASDIVHLGSSDWSYVVIEAATGHAITINSVETLTTTAAALTVGSAVGAFTIGMAAVTGGAGDDLTFQGQDTDTMSGGGFNFILGDRGESTPCTGTFRIAQGPFGDRLSVGDDIDLNVRNARSVYVTLNDDAAYFTVRNASSAVIFQIESSSSPKMAFFGATLKAQPARIGALTDSTGGTPGATIVALTDPTDSPATADALRDDLVTNLLPELRNNLASLTQRTNALEALVSEAASGFGLTA